MSEVRWLGFGEQRMTNGGVVLYSGRDEDGDHRNGVGMLISNGTKHFNRIASCMRKNNNCKF